jgi:hypothetical protein
LAQIAARAKADIAGIMVPPGQHSRGRQEL